MAELVSLGKGRNRAVVSLLGAELQTWSVDGADLLWRGDPSFWDQRSPLLFPVCGWTRGGVARVGGRSFPLGLHGFASRSRFELAEARPERARFVLRDSPETRAVYPFEFELAATYVLGARSLEIDIEVHNSGAGEMPYAAGLHPGFRIVKGPESRLAFDQAESPDVPVIGSGGLFSLRRRSAPLEEGRLLRLEDDLFSREALCFLDVRSRGLRLETARSPALRISWTNFSNIVVWSRVGAPFACVEAWTGQGDPEGFEGDLFEKPGMSILAPGERRRHGYQISLEQ